MSLGLFNCRLIQPAGDQLFFLSTVLPHRCQLGRALFSLRVTRPARSRPAGGRRMLLVFPSQKDSVLVFGRGETPVGCRRVHSHNSAGNSPKSTHRFCYRAIKRSVAIRVRTFLPCRDRGTKLSRALSIRPASQAATAQRSWSAPAPTARLSGSRPTCAPPRRRTQSLHPARPVPEGGIKRKARFLSHNGLPNRAASLEFAD